MLRQLLLTVIVVAVTSGSAHALTGERILKSPEWFVMVLASKMKQHAKCQLSDTEMLDVVFNAPDLRYFVGIYQRGKSFEMRNRINGLFNGIMVFTDLSTGETTSAALLSLGKKWGEDRYYTSKARDVSAGMEWYDELLVIDPAAKTVGPSSDSDRLTLERDYTCTFTSPEEVEITAQEPIRRAVALVRDEWHALTGNK